MPNPFSGNSIRAGKLRHRVQIQSATVARNAYGEEIRTWSTDYQCWAEIKPMSGGDSNIDGLRVVQRQYRVRMRYRPELTPFNRIKVNRDGRILNIASLLNAGERDRESVVEAVETVANNEI